MTLHVVTATGTAKPVPVETIRARIADIRFSAIGAAMIVPLKKPGHILRGFIAAGRSYSVHPIDLLDPSGELVELSTIRGLVPSAHPEFMWQVDARRRLLTVPMAEHELIVWANTYLDH